MKKSELRLMIRKIVREEVALSINEVLQEIKAPSSKPSKPVAKKSFTSNKILNDVLNETAMDNDWKTLGGSEFTTDRMNDIVGRNYNDITNSQPVTNIAAEMGVNPNDPAASFLKKDYRSLMKKVDEKQGKK